MRGLDVKGEGSRVTRAGKPGTCHRADEELLVSIQDPLSANSP